MRSWIFDPACSTEIACLSDVFLFLLLLLLHSQGGHARCFRFPVARHITCASVSESKEDLPDVDAEAGSPRALGAAGYLTVKQSG